MASVCRNVLDVGLSKWRSACWCGEDGDAVFTGQQERNPELIACQ